MKKIKFIFYTLIILLVGFFLLNILINPNKYLNVKSFLHEKLNKNQRSFIKKYIIPWNTISNQNQLLSEKIETIAQNDKKIYELSLKLEQLFKETSQNFNINRDEDIELSNNLILKKYNITNGFYAGINNINPGAGYIDFHLDNIIVLSSRGILGFTDNLNNHSNFKQIKNNLNEFIGYDQFIKLNWFSFKDINIQNDKILISYTEEIKSDCWNTSVVLGEMNYEEIIFKKLFSAKNLLKSKTCTHSTNFREAVKTLGNKFTPDNVDREFNAHQSGGRIINFDKNHILLSVGDYRNRSRVQLDDTLNGKIFKINIDDSKYTIISKGHRNPQGLYFDKENNYILETEHGPKGGDEINLIELERFSSGEKLNYGWPISSYGVHWPGANKEEMKLRYKKYPLKKSHSDFGFIEPIKFYSPAIGISEITKIGKNEYVHSSLKDKSLYFFKLSEKKELIQLKRVEVFERVRDMILNDRKIYLFLEDTASIGVINLN